MTHQHNSLFLCLLILSSVSALSAQKIKVDYNRKEDFSQLKSYSWIPQGAHARPFLAMDIMGAIDDELQAKGLKKVEDGGDMLVAAYGSLDEGVNVSYNVDVYAMPGLDGAISWANSPPVPGDSTAVYVAKGTLVVDLVDRKAKALAWRGIATAKLDPDQPDKSMTMIEKSITRMFRQYPH